MSAIPVVYDMGYAHEALVIAAVQVLISFTCAEGCGSCSLGCGGKGS